VLGFLLFVLPPPPNIYVSAFKPVGKLHVKELKETQNDNSSVPYAYLFLKMHVKIFINIVYKYYPCCCHVSNL